MKTLEEVRARLAELGYRAVEDGLGEETDRAIRRYQRDNDLPINGDPNDENLQSALWAAE